MREERIRPGGKHSCGEATRAKTPPVRATAQRDQCGQAHAKDLKQRGEGRSGAVKREPAKKERLRGNPIPAFSRQSNGMLRAADGSLPGKSANEIGQTGDCESAQRGHHHVTGAARPSQADVHEGQSSRCEWNQKDKEEASDRRYFRESREGHENYPFSSRGIRCDRKAKINPNASTATPARTNAARKGSDAKSTIAASTRNHPASSIRKPKNFIPNSLGSKQRDLLSHFRRWLKYHTRLRTPRVAPTILNVACAGQQAGPIAPAEEKVGRY